MEKAIQVQDPELLSALQEGADYLIVGKRRFLLVEVEEGEAGTFYDVQDPEEIEVARRALRDDSRRLAGEEAGAYLVNRLKEHGIR